MRRSSKKPAYTEDEWRIVMGKPLTLAYIEAGEYIRVIETGKIYYVETVTRKKYKGRPWRTWHMRELPLGLHHWMKEREAKSSLVERMVIVPENNLTKGDKDD